MTSPPLTPVAPPPASALLLLLLVFLPPPSSLAPARPRSSCRPASSPAPVSSIPSTMIMDSISPSPSNSSSGLWRTRISSMVAALAGKIICAVVTCVFTVVGSLLGAMMGALIGLATESGFIRGGGIGAISGAPFSVEVAVSSLALWHSNGSSISSILYVIGILTSLVNGRFVREKVGPAVESAVQSQMSAMDVPFMEVLNIFGTGGTRGMSKDFVGNLPKIKITNKYNVDAYGRRTRRELH